MLHLLAFVPLGSADRHLIEAENVNHVGIYLKMGGFTKFKPSDVFYAQSFACLYLGSMVEQTIVVFELRVEILGNYRG